MNSSESSKEYYGLLKRLTELTLAYEEASVTRDRGKKEELGLEIERVQARIEDLKKRK